MSTPLVAVIALVAALLGALAGMAYQTSRRRRARAARPASAPPARPSPPDQQSQSLGLENQRLRQQVATLRRELNELHHLSRPPAAALPSALKKRKPRPAPAPTPAEPVAPPATAAAETATPEEAALPAEAVAPAVRYASAVPGGYLADAQLAAQAMGRMPLAVCPDPAEPTRATFTLSPEVDKSWLIEAGLDRLRDYFDYEPPTGWPSTVAATAAGQLRREGEGWRVAPGGKGRLDVR